MATDIEIRRTKELLGPDAAAGGWTEDRINDDLDAGLSTYKIALAWWSYRAANTVNLTTVSESGSSRTLSDIHKNALAMMALYQKLSDAEDVVVPETPVDTGYGRGIRTFPIRRIERA